MSNLKKEDKKKRVLISQFEYAMRRRVSRQNINRHVKMGIITLIDEKIDPVIADRQLQENLDPAYQRKLSDG